MAILSETPGTVPHKSCLARRFPKVLHGLLLGCTLPRVRELFGHDQYVCFYKRYKFINLYIILKMFIRGDINIHQ